MKNTHVLRTVITVREDKTLERAIAAELARAEEDDVTDEFLRKMSRPLPKNSQEDTFSE